jgi:CRP-like cAMP-binding protein
MSQCQQEEDWGFGNDDDPDNEYVPDDEYLSREERFEIERRSGDLARSRRSRDIDVPDVDVTQADRSAIYAWDVEPEEESELLPRRRRSVPVPKNAQARVTPRQRTHSASSTKTKAMSPDKRKRDFVMMDKKLAERTDLTLAEKAVLAYLKRLQQIPANRGVASVRQKVIADWWGLTRRQVGSALKGLEGHGLIARKRQGPGKATVYTITSDAPSHK